MASNLTISSQWSGTAGSSTRQSDAPSQQSATARRQSFCRGGSSSQLSFQWHKSRGHQALSHPSRVPSQRKRRSRRGSLSCRQLPRLSLSVPAIWRCIQFCCQPLLPNISSTIVQLNSCYPPQSFRLRRYGSEGVGCGYALRLRAQGNRDARPIQEAHSRDCWLRDLRAISGPPPGGSWPPGAS